MKPITTHDAYASRYMQNWRDPSPKARAANDKFSRLCEERGLNARWRKAVRIKEHEDGIVTHEVVDEQERVAILAEMQLLEVECGLSEPEPIKQQALHDRIRLR